MRSHRQAVELVDATPPSTPLRLLIAAQSVQVDADKSKGVVGLTCTNSKRGRGVVVTALKPDSILPAARLYIGDTIVAIDGQLVDRHRDAVDLIDEASGHLKLTKWGHTRSVVVEKREAGNSEECGVTLCDLESEERQAGVRVLAARPGGSFAAAGVRTGDVILAIDGKIATDHRQARSDRDATARARPHACHSHSQAIGLVEQSSTTLPLTILPCVRV